MLKCRAWGRLMQVSLDKLLSVVPRIFVFDRVELVQTVKESQLAVTYKLRADGRLVCLKVHPPQYSSGLIPEIRAYVIGALIARDVTCPDLLRVARSYSKDGIHAVEGSRYFSILDHVAEAYEWIDAETYTASDESFLSCIDFAALICRAFDTIALYPGIADERFVSLFKRNMIRGGGSHVLDGIAYGEDAGLLTYATIDALRAVRSIDEDFRKREDGFRTAMETFQPRMIHGDLIPNNMGFVEGEARILYDFESAGVGFWLDDVSWLFFELCCRDDNPSQAMRKVARFKSRFEEQYSVRIDVNLMFDLVLRRLLRHIRNGIEAIRQGTQPSYCFVDVFIEGIQRVDRLRRYWRDR
jgi:hypothetical protein